MREQRPPSHRHCRIDQTHQAQPTQVVLDQDQRAHLTMGTDQRRVQATERSCPAVQLPRGLQLVQAPQGCHNTLPDLAIFPPALDKLQVLMDLVAPADPLDPRIHRWHTYTAPVPGMQAASSNQRWSLVGTTLTPYRRLYPLQMTCHARGFRALLLYLHPKRRGKRA